MLQSSDAYWGSYLVSTGTLINDVTGVIDVEGVGTGRAITGNLVNEGLISVAADTQLQINCDGGPGRP